MEIILALGVVLGSIFFSEPKMTPPDNEDIQKWEQTSLNPSLLKALVNDTLCNENERIFLSCADALLDMTKVMNVSISPKGSYIRLKDQNQITKLSPWKQAFNQKKHIPWNDLVNKIFKDTEPKLHSLLTAEGISGYLSVKEDPHTYLEVVPKKEILSSLDDEDFMEEKSITNQAPSKEESSEDISGEVTLALNKRLDLPSLLTISSFDPQTCEKVATAFRKIKKHNVNKLVLDLKDNHGGLVWEAVCVSSLLVGRQKIVTLKPFADKEKTYYGFLDQVYSGELTVFTNDETASSAEILSGVLKHYKRGKIVGQKTYGKGSFQEVVPSIYDQYGVRLRKTAGLYYLPDNTSPQLVGIEPDIFSKERPSEDGYESGFLYPLKAPSLETSQIEIN